MATSGDDRKLLLLLHQMRERRCARWFLRPVDPVADGVPNYLEIIKAPMDLGTIGHKLERGAYEEREDYAEDVRLMINNALTYNPDPQSRVHKDAIELSTFFENKWNGIAVRNQTKKKENSIEKKRKHTTERKNTEQNHSALNKKKQLSSSEENNNRPRPKKRKKKSFQPDTALKLLTYLVAQPHAYHFKEPVDAVALGIPEYHDIISEPMDLTTIREKIKAGQYETNEAFVRDLRLIFDNAITFNTEPKNEVRKDAIALSKVFESKFQELFGIKLPPPPIQKKSIDQEEEIHHRQKEDAHDKNMEALSWREKCRQLLEEIAARPEAFYFLVPVDLNMAPGYLEIVRQPMDLGTVAQKLDTYASADEMIRDTQLVIDNALLYNTDATHPVRQAALKLRKALKLKFEEYSLITNNNELHKKLSNLVEQLQAHENAFFFSTPVDPIAMGCPDYFQIIQRPMDIGTLNQMIPEYQSPEAFYNDASLIFTNAKTYNPEPTHPVHIQAAQLEAFFQERFFTMFPKENSSSSDDTKNQSKRKRENNNDQIEAEWIPSSRPRSDEEKMQKLVDLILRQPNANQFFAEPVNPENYGIRDYFEIIKKPMDFGTIQNKIAHGTYRKEEKPWEHFIDDVRLVFNNARTYNKSTKHIVHYTAVACSKVFEKELRALDLLPKMSEKDYMRQILSALKSRTDLAFFFLEPVDPQKLGLHDYHEIIKEPMDLGTIESKIAQYKSLESDFAYDVRLVFNNAITYNKNPKLAVHDAAKRLLAQFEAKLTAALKKWDGNHIKKEVLPNHKAKAMHTDHSLSTKPEPSNTTTNAPLYDEDEDSLVPIVKPKASTQSKRKAEEMNKLSLKINRVSKPLPKRQEPSAREEEKEKRHAPLRPPPANFFALHIPPVEKEPFEIEKIFLLPTTEEIEQKYNNLDLSHLDREFPPEAFENDIPDLMKPDESLDPELHKSWQNYILNLRYERQDIIKLEKKRLERLRETQRREAEYVCLYIFLLTFAFFRRVQEELDEAERRRIEEEEAQAEKLEEERQQQIEAERRRAEQREQKRKERAKLQQTVDLDKDRLEVADFLAAYGDANNVGADESIE
mmetsp:Transcript_10061/g.15267  ORF Transcript_10061/g.15267 Transcript_10061/m.15267 type:complete len:1089 (+) Transcript_10061:74-3340(+)